MKVFDRLGILRNLLFGDSKSDDGFGHASMNSNVLETVFVRNAIDVV